MKRITAAMLIRAGAKRGCDDLRLFRKTFPLGAPVTMAAMQKADKVGLDVLWCTRLLPDQDLFYYREMVHLREERRSKEAKIRDECRDDDGVINHIDYWAKLGPIYSEYLEKCKPILLESLLKAKHGRRESA